MRPARIKTENGALNGVKCVKKGALLTSRLYKFTLKWCIEMFSDPITVYRLMYVSQFCIQDLGLFNEI